MSEEKIIQVSLDDILNEAIDTTNGDATYITNIRFRVTNNDVTLDMYYIGPNPKDPTVHPQAYLRNRIVIPVGLAKNIGSLLVNAMSDWEDTFGVTLPISPNEIEENSDDE